MHTALFNPINKPRPIIYKTKILGSIVLACAGFWFISTAACAVETQTITDQEGNAQKIIPTPDNATTSRWLDEKWRGGRIEIKRQNTSRGTPEESTKTNLRLEAYFNGTVSLLRLDIPFPDKQSDFDGSPTEPRLGDIKTRVGFRSFEAYSHTFNSFIEATFPTANSEPQGSGQYQLSAGVNMKIPLNYFDNKSEIRDSEFGMQIKQTNSIAGDSSDKDINHTNFEFNLYDTWHKKYRLKLELNPTVDWVENGQTGAVGEIEGRVSFRRNWQTWIMLGKRVWGPSDVPGTYSDRVELGLARNFK